MKFLKRLWQNDWFKILFILLLPLWVLLILLWSIFTYDLNPIVYDITCLILPPAYLFLIFSSMFRD